MSDFPRELELGLIRGGIQVTELPSMQGIPEEHDRALLKQAATLAARSDLTETFQVGDVLGFQSVRGIIFSEDTLLRFRTASSEARGVIWSCPCAVSRSFPVLFFYQVFPNAPPLAASPTAALLVQEDPVSGESQHLHAPNCSGSSGPAGQAFFALIAGQMVSSLLLWVLDCFGKRRVHESASLPQLVWCRR